MQAAVNNILLTGPSGREIIAQSPVPLPTTAQPTPALAEPPKPAAPAVTSPGVIPTPGAATTPPAAAAVAAGAYRYMSYVSGPTGTIDIYTTGMMTAFRRVTWAKREYIEMTVTW